MCGIAGLVYTNSVPSQDIIKKMTAVLAHRGPDSQAVKCLPGCDLGHARLSILDLQTGDQPMSDAGGRFWITFNGEIYNYGELRSQLVKKGCRFQTHSDTEVILNAYAKRGAGCLQHFRGMFAFAIWDNQEKTLFCARDLFGEKPLYYALLPGGGLILASEIKAILASNLLSPQLDLDALDAYLAYMYIPPDRTIYRNIQVLPPAHTLIWQRDQVKTNCWWEPQFSTCSISLGDASERLDELMQQAVRRQMVADVPVGAFLSGGLDSSTIVALMQQQSPSPVKTFSVGFGTLINELPFARALAEKYHTEHYEIQMELPPLGELFEQVTAVYDEPFADSSAIPTYLISQFARKQVKVALSGDGGDELFGGYAWYQGLIGIDPPQQPVSPIRRMVDRFYRCLLPRAALELNWESSELPPTWARHIQDLLYTPNAIRQEMWGKRREHITTFFPASRYLPDAHTRGLNQAFYFDMLYYLPGDILVKVDRAAMANSLETRAPFLDRDLAEFSLTLPEKVKLTREESKIIMRRGFAKYWTPEIAKRQKQGFGVPYQSWLRQPELQGLLNRVFAPGSRLRRLLPGLRSDQTSPDTYQTWILLTLGIWLEQHQLETA